MPQGLKRLRLAQLLSTKGDQDLLLLIVTHLRNRDGAENLQNAFVNAAKRFANRTLGCSVAIAVTRDTRCNQHGPVDGCNDLQSADTVRFLRELIATRRTVLGADKRVPRQLLQNLRHQCAGDAVFLGNFIGAAGMRFPVMQSQMLDGNQAVICLLGKLKHPTDARVQIQRNMQAYATESVGIKSRRYRVESQTRNSQNKDIVSVSFP
jgi:hypothetical protein